MNIKQNNEIRILERKLYDFRDKNIEFIMKLYDNNEMTDYIESQIQAISTAIVTIQVAINEIEKKL